MKKISFKVQAVIVFILIGIGHLLAVLLKNGIYINVVGVISGLLFLVNPVYPNIKTTTPQKGVLGARIGGVLIIIMSLLTRNGV